MKQQRTSQRADRNGPKKLQAVQTSRHFRVSHPQHTGRILPRQHTSYPVLAMILLCTGVLLAGWTHMVTAGTITASDQYTVHASVPGSPPAAPTITSPATGFRTDTKPISINGNCDLSSYIKLTRNGVMSGTALCDADGHFAIQTDLYKGKNHLVATAYNLANQPSATGAAVDVYYQPAKQAQISGTTTYQDQNGQIISSVGPDAGVQAYTAPLTLTTAADIQGVYTGDAANWDINISGGTAPYAVAVDWGDGNSEVFSWPKPGNHSLMHTYRKHGGYSGNYPIAIQASDSAGQKTMLQLFVIVNNRDSSPAAGSQEPKSGGSLLSGIQSLMHGDFGPFMKYAWPSFGVTSLMLTSFWLGELREMKYLRPRLRKVPHRHA